MNKYLREVAEDEVPDNVFLGMHLNPGANRLNVIALLFSFYVANMMLQFQTTFISYLLEEHYDIPEKEAPKVSGDIGLVGEVGNIVFALVIGYLMDLFGRKWLTIGGLMMASLATMLKPVPDKIGYLYVLRTFTNIGMVALINTPFTLDYIRKQSIGMIMASHSIIGTLAGITVTTGCIQLDKVMQVGYVYVGIGILSLLVSVVLAFGLNDIKLVVVRDPKKARSIALDSDQKG